MRVLFIESIDLDVGGALHVFELIDVLHQEAKLVGVG